MIVAQLSDIHADGSDGRLDRLDRVLSWLRPMRPDAIIVSGDLAEMAHQASYRAIHDRLDATGSPFYVVPGNVDDHGDMRREFGHRFGWPAEGRALNCSAQVGSRLRVIGLDVTVAAGHHGDALPVLDWLAEELDAGGPPALIFQHQHPFLCGIEGKDRNMCRGHDELARVIEKARDPVVALTCGHVHRPMFTRFAGRPAVMCPSVTRANRLHLDGREPEIVDPPGLLLHHFDDERLVTHVVMVS
ncbi:metallophosphoesterase [Devosia sp.]|uniref:metallophosphoesterase n=1 Tax=Devosia sp. TaxID=1871048 RepID=UPI002FC9E46C